MLNSYERLGFLNTFNATHLVKSEAALTLRT